MKDKELRNYLQHSLSQETDPDRMEETIKLCAEIVREQRALREETRLCFWGYLSNIFRFEGIPILILQAIILLLVCFAIYTEADAPKNIPIFMPLFVLAVIPAIFKVQYYGMSEIEAVTRTSSAQIILAKLILAGAANLVSITILLCLEVYLKNSSKEMGQMILYCLVPYLVCMAAMLRLIRLRKGDNMTICGITIFGSCAVWGGVARTMPGLYEASAIGVWIIAFMLFAAFFIKEIYYIVKMGKEGKIYGIIA